MPGSFDFLNGVNSNLSQSFAPELGQTNSTGVNPLQNYAPSLPNPPQVSAPAQGQQMMPSQEPQPPATSALTQDPTQQMQQPQMQYPITLQDLLKLGVQSYLQQLIAAQKAQGGQ